MQNIRNLMEGCLAHGNGRVKTPCKPDSPLIEHSWNDNIRNNAQRFRQQLEVRHLKDVYQRVPMPITTEYQHENACRDISEALVSLLRHPKERHRDIRAATNDMTALRESHLCTEPLFKKCYCYVDEFHKRIGTESPPSRWNDHSLFLVDTYIAPYYQACMFF
jgi:hypothetical protein